VVQDGDNRVLGQSGIEQGSAFAFGEACLAGLAVEQAALVAAIAPADGEVAVPAFAVWGECTYENEYVKVNGAWKIAKLYSYFNMYTPYAEGWGKTGMPNTRPEKNLPPDG